MVVVIEEMRGKSCGSGGDCCGRSGGDGVTVVFNLTFICIIKEYMFHTLYFLYQT